MRGGEAVVPAIMPRAAGFKSMRRRRHPNLRLAVWSVPGIDRHGTATRGGQPVTDLSRWGSLVGFPEKPSSWSRAQGVLALALRHRRPAVFGLAAAIGLAASVGLGIGVVRYLRLAAVDRAAITRTESANADLQDALARLRDQLGTTNQALNQEIGRAHV